MGELIHNIWLVFKALFFDWIPKLANVDMGPIGELKSAIGYITAGGILLTIIIKKLRET